MELLVVLGIFAILGSMTISSFGGLQNTVKMNEYVLTLEQDISSVQRAAMLLERESGENWLYGIGIDFGTISTAGEYKMFKWCSTYADYGDITTKSDFPYYNPNLDIGETNSDGESNGYIVTDGISTANTCSSSALSPSLVTLSGYDDSLELPISNIMITKIGDDTPRYIVFESVSGRTFFYGTDGKLLNYSTKGIPITSESFTITINPVGTGKTRVVSISNLSGKVTSITQQE